jgi:hypothetical protein
MPDPDLFGNPDAYLLYTRYAAELKDAGLADRFPADPELRNVVIEVLAQRHAVEDLPEALHLIDGAIVEAEDILEERRRRQR